MRENSIPHHKPECSRDRLVKQWCAGGKVRGGSRRRDPSLDQAKDREKERTDYYFRKQATAEKPIVFRPAGDGDVILWS